MNIFLSIPFFSLLVTFISNLVIVTSIYERHKILLFNSLQIIFAV